MDISNTTENYTWPYSNRTDAPRELEFWGFWMKEILTPVVVVVGIVGNALSFVVMKTSALRYKSYSHYLCALAVFDSLTLIGREIKLIDEMMIYLGSPGVFINFTRLTCKLYDISEHISYLMSSWLVVVMAFERIVAIFFPFRKRTVCKQTVAVTLIFILLLVISSTQIFRLMMMNKDEGKCVSDHQYRVTYLMLHTYFYQVCLMFALPVSLVLICNTLVLYKIHSVRKATQDEDSTCSRLTRIGSHRYKTTIMLLTISFVYVICTFPMIITTVIVLIALESGSPEGIRIMFKVKPFADALEVLSVTNYGVNFFIYVLSGKAFRRELLEMIYGQRRQSYSSTRTRESQVR